MQPDKKWQNQNQFLWLNPARAALSGWTKGDKKSDINLDYCPRPCQNDNDNKLLQQNNYNNSKKLF